MISDEVLTHVLVALAVLLVAGAVVGALFERLRQPRSIGEIVGGLLVGPTVLGAVAPQAVSWMFAPDGPGAVAIGLIQQLGLLLLLFCAGGEMSSNLRRRARSTVTIVSTTGLAIPALVTAGILVANPFHSLWGPSGTRASFALVAVVAMAVTSIPVISRIMADIGILRTPFARIVLSVAVVEDIVLYVVLAVAVALVTPAGASSFGLSAWLGLSAGSDADIALHVGMTVLLLVGVLAFGTPLIAFAARLARITIGPAKPVVSRLLVLFCVTAVALILGVQPFLAAFVAGIAVARAATGPAAADTHRTVNRFASGFFIPVYFTLVGATLDLRHDFDVLFFVAFFVIACLVKALSVYVGARLAHHPARTSADLAVALNARGGPGIVLATTAYGADIITLNGYAILVLLAVLSSLLAGGYLARRPMTAFDLADEPGAGTADATVTPVPAAATVSIVSTTSAPRLHHASEGPPSNDRS